MRKVAIVRRNGLGDLLLTVPLLYALKNEGDTSITLFLDERNALLIPYLPKVFDKHVILPKRGNKYLHLLKVALKYRKEKFDIVISSKTSPMKFMNLFLFALGGKKRIAYVDKSFSSLFINEKVIFNKMDSETKHQSLKALHLIQKNQVKPEWFPKLQISENLKKSYPAPFVKKPLILLSATTTNVTSRIEPLKYAEAINRLGKDFSFSVLLISEKKDEKRLLSISEKLKVRHECRIPQNFEEFMILQNYCDLYFVPDGGLAHIGAGLQKSQVVLFGATSPRLWGPLSLKTCNLYHQDHVDQIRDEDIDKALRAKFCEVMSGRSNQ